MNRSSKEKRARAGMLSGIDEANYMMGGAE